MGSEAAPSLFVIDYLQFTIVYLNDYQQDAIRRTHDARRLKAAVSRRFFYYSLNIELL